MYKRDFRFGGWLSGFKASDLWHGEGDSCEESLSPSLLICRESSMYIAVIVE